LEQLEVEKKDAYRRKSSTYTRFRWRKKKNYRSRLREKALQLWMGGKNNITDLNREIKTDLDEKIA
jgi:hypothetical protein